MAVTANQLIARQEGCRQSHKAAVANLYEGTLGFLNAAGYLDDDTATGANKFAGVVIRNVDNSAGAAGDLECEVWETGEFELAGTFTQDDEGKVCYATDNYTVSTAYSASAVRIGTISKYVSSTRAKIRIEIYNADGLEYAAVAASAAHTNTTTAADFDKSHSIPANTLRVGDIIRIRGQAIATATNSTDTLTLLLTVGGVTIATTGAVDVANGDIGYFECDVVVRTIGASGTIVAAGVQALGVPGTVTAKPFLLASSTLDTTAAAVVAVNADWSVANAGNSARLDVLNVEIIRKR